MRRTWVTYGQLRRTPPSISTRARSKRRRTRNGICLKATKEESTRSTASWHSTAFGSVEECRRALQGQGRRRVRDRQGHPAHLPLRTPCWAYTLGAAIALKKGVKTAAEAAEKHRRRPAGLLHPRLRRRRAARWAWATATWARCCCARRPSASASWPATSPSPPPRAPSASSATPTRCARARCASS